MVATLVRLRLLLLRNSLKRSTAQLVLVILGALYGLGILVSAVIGLAVLGIGPVSVIRIVTVLAGSGLVLGWIVIPIFASGIDQTLDPRRLVTFPIPLNTLLGGLAVSSVLGVAGFVTTAASFATALSWVTRPAIIPIALISGVLGAATCICAAQAVVAVSGGLASRRRFREFSSIAIFVPLILLGPILVSATSGLRGAGALLPTAARILSWTPLGAIWAVPSSIASGAVLRGVLEFLIGLATLVVLVALWRWGLSRTLVTPTHTASREVGRGKLGFFGLYPASPTGAVAARSLTYWVRDPRYTRQFLVVPLIPVLLGFYSFLIHTPGLLLGIGPVTALLLSLAIYTDISYDNTAFALHISNGVSGRADRIGRSLAVATFAVPIVLALTIASTIVAGSAEALPGMLGLSVGVLLTGLGVSSVTSARFVFPVPLPGDSPFSSKPGASLTAALTTYAVWAILVVLVIPEFALLVIGGITGEALYQWLGLVVGLGLGSGLFVLGTNLGARLLERGAVRLFQSISRER